MTNSGYSPLFFSAELSKIRRGTVDVGVPLEDGAVQLDAINIAERGRLVVAKTFRNISVVRDDGSPLQAQVVEESYEDTDEGIRHHLTRSNIFREPVEELKFMRTRDVLGEICWYADGEGMDVTSQQHIQRLARAIGIYASAKQRHPIRRSMKSR